MRSPDFLPFTIIMRIDKNLEIFSEGDVGMLRCVYSIAVTETINSF